MSRTLSHQVEAIEYIHAADGLPYRHDFTRGDSKIVLANDGSVRISNAQKKLWGTFDYRGKQQDFLINHPKGSKPSTQRARTIMAKRKKRATHRKRNAKGHFLKTTTPRRKANAPKRARARSASAHAPTKRSTRRRRNPPLLSMTGVVGRTGQAFVDGAFVGAGKLGVRYLSSLTPQYTSGSMMQAVVETAGVAGICWFAPRFLGADRARMLAAGAAWSVEERFVKQIGIPQVNTLLAGTPWGMNTRAIYPAADAGAMARYGPAARIESGTVAGYGPSNPAARVRSRRANAIG